MELIFKVDKEKTKENVIEEIVTQLDLIKNVELVSKIKTHLIEPILHFAIWDYSETETKYPVWLIASSATDNTGILFSEYGYSFDNWGLVVLSDKPFHFGMDYQWYKTLEEAFLDSFMADK